MSADPDLHAYADSVGAGVEAAWGGLSAACDVSTSCAAGPDSSNKFHSILENRGRSFAMMVSQRVWDALLSVDSHHTEACASSLMCCIDEVYHGGSGSTCSESHGDCRWGRPPNVFHRPFAWMQGELLAVAGVDNAGRWTEQQFMHWWRKATSAQPLGLQLRALTMVVGAAVWPVQGRPTPPLGDTKLTPLIIGNMYDPRTAYHNAQNMNVRFPRGTLITWQGFGHGFQMVSGRSLQDAAKRDCFKRIVTDYLRTGVPPKHHICKGAPGIPKFESCGTSYVCHPGQHGDGCHSYNYYH